MGVLVDTSIWIDHLHHGERVLIDLLERDELWTHELVLEELVMGSSPIVALRWIPWRTS